MNRTPVSSSHIVSIGHDSNTLTLEVEFNNGAVYQYFDVPEPVYTELMQADSKGKYMNANVKGFYRETKT